MAWVRRYTWNVLVSLDQFANTLLGGSPDETISSRLGKKQRAGVLSWYNRWLVALLHWIDPNHSLDAIEEDEGADAVIRNPNGESH